SATPRPHIHSLSLHDALPISRASVGRRQADAPGRRQGSYLPPRSATSTPPRRGHRAPRAVVSWPTGHTRKGSALLLHSWMPSRFAASPRFAARTSQLSDPLEFDRTAVPLPDIAYDEGLRAGITARDGTRCRTA